MRKPPDRHASCQLRANSSAAANYSLCGSASAGAALRTTFASKASQVDDGFDRLPCGHAQRWSFPYTVKPVDISHSIRPSTPGLLAHPMRDLDYAAARPMRRAIRLCWTNAGILTDRPHDLARLHRAGVEVLGVILQSRRDLRQRSSQFQIASVLSTFSSPEKTQMNRKRLTNRRVDGSLELLN